MALNVLLTQDDIYLELQASTGKILLQDSGSQTDLSISGTAGTSAINKNYPNVEGLQAGTTKQTGDPNL